MHLKGLVVLACRGLQSFRLRFASFCLVDAAGAISGPDFGHRRSHLAASNMSTKSCETEDPEPQKNPENPYRAPRGSLRGNLKRPLL